MTYFVWFCIAVLPDERHITWAACLYGHSLTELYYPGTRRRTALTARATV